MRWADVEAGQSVEVKGETWKVLKVEGGAVTMRHASLGERTGRPVGEVHAVPTPRRDEPRRDEPRERAAAALPDLELRTLRKFAREEGFTEADLRGLDVDGIREAVGRRRMVQVAADNDVPVRAVEDAHIRLVLGATVIAELRTSLPPATPQVEVMDRQTFANHMAFFHDSYPSADIAMDKLAESHQASHDGDREVARHTHTVPF